MLFKMTENAFYFILKTSFVLIFKLASQKNDLIKNITEHLSIFSPNAGKYGPEKRVEGGCFSIM